MDMSSNINIENKGEINGQGSLTRTWWFDRSRLCVKKLPAVFHLFVITLTPYGVKSPPIYIN